MSRAIVVLSAIRSGSSATAGVLHCLGVDMGEGFLQVPDINNPGGYYEDVRWGALCKSLVGVRYTTRRVQRLGKSTKGKLRKFIEMREHQPIWGVKSPRTAYLFPLITELFEDLRIIVVGRPFEDIIASTVQHSKDSYGGVFELTEEEATRIVTDWLEALADAVAFWKGPALRVCYDDLVGDSRVIVEQIAQFAFEGLDFGPSPGEITSAVEWIDGGLKHHGGDTDPDAQPETAEGETKTSRKRKRSSRKKPDCPGCKKPGKDGVHEDGESGDPPAEVEPTVVEEDPVDLPAE